MTESTVNKSNSNAVFLNFKDHVTLKTGVTAAENSALHNRNKIHFKTYSKQSFYNVTLFHNITVFIVFLIK